VRKLAFAVLPLLVAALPGCGKGCGRSGDATRATVAVSIFPIYDLARRVAGPDADVMLLLPPGRNEHSASWSGSASIRGWRSS
jgi:ABC-type Zn uptake system ZnuABC Zn-binding protein ZnuA